VDVRVEEGRYLADRIAGARLVELPGVDHFVAVDPDQILDQVEPFVGSLGRSAPAQPEPERGERVLATIFVSDLPKAAETLAEVGDRAWAEILLRYDAVLREELARHGAADIDRAGEGFIATFDGPGRGIRCALAVQERLRRLGLEASLGLHTGEIIRCDGDLRGIAVHTAARVAAESAPGEILVTATTRDLVAGSGLAFADGGERHLKGIEGPRRLYAVADGVLHPQPAFARA
jgi:class 3 adenylate cyclase